MCTRAQAHKQQQSNKQSRETNEKQMNTGDANKEKRTNMQASKQWNKRTHVCCQSFGPAFFVGNPHPGEFLQTAHRFAQVASTLIILHYLHGTTALLFSQQRRWLCWLFPLPLSLLVSTHSEKSARVTRVSSKCQRFNRYNGSQYNCYHYRCQHRISMDLVSIHGCNVKAGFVQILILWSIAWSRMTVLRNKVYSTRTVSLSGSVRCSRD